MSNRTGSFSRTRTLLAIGALVAAAATASATAATATTQSAGSYVARGHHQHPPAYAWHITPTGTAEEFRGLAAVSASTAWVSGEDGGVLRTVNAGETWQDVSPPQAADMALRDIEAFGPRRAVALAIGTGDASRIFATNDGGATWDEVFRNTDPNAFYDCMAFSHDGLGLAMSDPVGGHFQLARTTDFGQTWAPFLPSSMPAALPTEFAFAASGTCIVSSWGHTFWFATGGADTPRVFRSFDGGRHWTVHDTDMRGGPSAGIYSLAFRNPLQGIAVGGDFQAETDGSDAAAWTLSFGQRWHNSTSPVGGYRSGVAFVPFTFNTAIAVGPTGSDVSVDGGRSWTTFDTDRYDGVQCARDGACWASGTDGRVSRLVR
jgi:photosystem II stability/assembly factor-like uncharacterized protein